MSLKASLKPPESPLRDVADRLAQESFQHQGVHRLGQRHRGLIAGEGEFESPEEFYSFWRDSARRWKKSPEAERLIRKALQEHR